MLSQSLQTTVDSIALQTKLKTYMKTQLVNGDTATVALLMRARDWSLDELVDLFGF